MGPGRTAYRERGSASLEAVALVPVLLLVALCVFQVGLAGWAAVSATGAARAAARAATLDQDARAAAEGALPGGLSVASLSEQATPDGRSVRVTVRIPDLTPLTLGTVTREADLPDIS